MQCVGDAAVVVASLRQVKQIDVEDAKRVLRTSKKYEKRNSARRELHSNHRRIQCHRKHFKNHSDAVVRMDTPIERGYEEGPCIQPTR
jgi:hypothetical protein